MTYHDSGARGLWRVSVLTAVVLAEVCGPAPGGDQDVVGKAHAILEQHCQKTADAGNGSDWAWPSRLPR